MPLLTYECERCGNLMEGRGSKHVCTPRPAARAIVKPPEWTAEEVAYRAEMRLAVADACTLHDEGWGIEPAITHAMERIRRAAEKHGWYRAVECAHARKISINDFTAAASPFEGDIQ
jgi:hypothetical protein